MIRETIEKAVTDALKDFGAGGSSFVVERPGSISHGDYSTNAALVAKVDPHALVAKLQIEGVEKIEVVGRFINFWLSRKELRKSLLAEDLKIPQINKDKIILVEYTSPNLFKPLHIGNLVGNILGESIAHLLETTGADVKRLNYPSDIGLTVAKGVYGLIKLGITPVTAEDLGKAYVLGNIDYELGTEEEKKKIEEINRKLYEASDEELNKLRAIGFSISRSHLQKLCKTLGTEFDKEFFESQSGPLGRDLVRQHISTIFEESEGAVVFKGSHTRVFLNSAGLPTYEAKELGLFKLKSDFYPMFDESYTVTGSEQKDFFSVVFEAVRKVFPDRTSDKTIKHIANGFLRLTTGKMSSRKGNVITGESLLENLTKVARGRKDVAVGAIKYSVLKSGSGKDITFDLDKSLSLEGDSGPYLQYALVRARALIRKAAEAEISDYSGIQHVNEFNLRRDLMRALYHFSDTVARSAKEFEPHHLTTYLTEIASIFNSWYAAERVIVDGKVDPEMLALVKRVEQTLAKGLGMLGIPAPEEM